ncbi:hypothetical protein OKA06_06120 [Novosphingobium sp. MW5]|nr:hypothetical protein [Novosphingobium sp. MW5]
MGECCAGHGPCSNDGQRTGAQRRGGSPSASAQRPLPPEPVKRTWDFTRRFGIINLGGRGGCGADAEQAKAALDASNRLLEEFLSGPADAKKLGLERKNYLAQVLGAGPSIDTYLTAFNNVGKRGPDGYVPSAEQDLCNARGQHLSVLAVRDGLAGIARLYPDMNEAQVALAQANAALTKMGGEESATQMVSRNRSGSLASVRLKPALSNNPQWIAGFRSAFPRLVPGQTVMKIHPYSANWYVHKNETTSYPEYRQIGAWVAAKKADGTCWIHSVDLWQNFTGSGFDSGEYKLGGPPQQIRCENL